MKTVEKIYIEKLDSLDPITVYLDGGRITVICYANAWTTFFGSFSGTLLEFLRGCYPDYLCSRFEQSVQGTNGKMKRIDKEYLFRVSTAVINHLKTIPENQPEPVPVSQAAKPSEL